MPTPKPKRRPVDFVAPAARFYLVGDLARIRVLMALEVAEDVLDKALPKWPRASEAVTRCQLSIAH
jgi:hypothetical protein